MKKLVDYETDFCAWALHNAQLLKEGRFSEIDVEHLIAELEDMGKSQRQELESRLVILLAHLLKWAHQPSQRGRSWKRSIDEQRVQIVRRLQKTPSLKPQLPEAITEAYAYALKLAIKETGLAKTYFPTACQYTIEQILDEDFYPDNSR